jgi:feruloyl-CoA synthase
MTFADAKAQSDSVAQALFDRGLGEEKPVMILSGNSLEFAILSFAAMTVGAPVAPVSPAYSLLSKDFANLKQIFDLVRPALIFANDGEGFARALSALDLKGIEIVNVTSLFPGATPFADLLNAPVSPEVARSMARIGPDTVAKYLFTSGSTGVPKGVINTQRMMCANVAMYDLVRPRQDVGVTVDWMPWHHTFAGNASFNMALNRGWATYLDKGRPVPGQFDESIRNLREISPTTYASVPVAFAMLAQAMENDDELRVNFFRRLSVMFYGGAALPDDIFDRMQELAVRTTGQRIVMLTGYGSTETAPSLMGSYWFTERSGLLGLPKPGVELKLVPDGDRFEIRCKGPNVMPGYLKRPDLTEKAFDEEGYYMIGDAARWVDPDDPQEGLAFAGRVAENFKLFTGTWVQTGTLRVAALAVASPLLRDAVVAGQDKSYVGLLAWPNIEALRALCPDGSNLGLEGLEDLVRRPEVVAHIRKGLRSYNADHGSASRIARVLLMVEPPNLDEGEITDKGYINQRRTLERRTELVERLYADPPPDDVIVV